MADDFDQNDPNYIPPTTDAQPTLPEPNDEAGKTAQTPEILTQNASNISTPKLPEGGEAKVEEQKVGVGETGGVYDHNIAAPTPVTTATVEKPKEVKQAEYTAQSIGVENAPKVDAAKGALSEEAKAQAATQEDLNANLKQKFNSFDSELNSLGVDPNSTVQEQYKKLTDFSGGMPGWAQGAVTKANQIMAKRGLGNSSAAAGAITAEVLKAAMPIAVQDAQVFQTLQLKKLDLKAQSTFLQAGYISQLDMKNLDNRQQIAVTNAQNFLGMDLANLSNEQQAAVISSQNRLQVLLSDQSAVNAARQFNATGKMQTDQYNASLATSIATFNANQLNDTSKFNEQMLQDAWKFNVNNQTLIDQSNINYLRNINTQNTAAKNAANLTNSTNLVNISNTAMANGIQMLRDQTDFSFQMGENEKDRAQQAAMLQLQNQQWFQRYDTQQKDALWKSVGNFVAGAAGTYINRGITTGNWGFGSGSSGGGTSGGQTSWGGVAFTK